MVRRELSACSPLDHDRSHLTVGCRYDRATVLDAEGQTAQVVAEPLGHRAEPFGRPVVPANDPQHHVSGRSLHCLELPDEVLPRVAEEHVEHDPGDRVAFAVDQRVRTATVDALEDSQAATAATWRTC